MDKMTLIDIFLVGVLEVFFIILFGLVLIKGKNFYKNYNNIFLKIFLSIFTILFSIYISRSYFNSLIVTTLISTLIYSLHFLLVFKFNIRQSMIAGCLNMFILMTCETLLLQPALSLINSMFSIGSNFFSARLLWSLPTRLIQIIIITYMILKNCNLANNGLLVKKWDSLSISRKVTLVLLITCLWNSILLNSNYGEIFVKLKINNIPTEILAVNLVVLIVSIVVFLCVALILLSRTFEYENIKAIVYNDPENLIESILSVSDPAEVYRYKDIIDKHSTAIEGGDRYEKI